MSKTFYPRPLRCVIVVHSYSLAQEDTTLLTESACLPCAKICIDDSRISPDLHKDKRVTLNKKQKSQISNGAAFITETNQARWSLLTNTIPHGRTIMYMVTLATEASMMAVGHFSKIFDPAENGLQLADDFVIRLKNEFASNGPNVIFSYAALQDDDNGETCRDVFTRNLLVAKGERERQGLHHFRHERHSRDGPNAKWIPCCAKGDLASFCYCPATLESLRLWAQRAHTLVSHETWTLWKQI